jgi:hypothetical protein
MKLYHKVREQSPSLREEYVGLEKLNDIMTK